MDLDASVTVGPGRRRDLGSVGFDDAFMDRPREFVRAALVGGGREVATDIIQHWARGLPGRLRTMLRATVRERPEGVEIRVGAVGKDAYLVRLLETGTKPHEIAVRRARRTRRGVIPASAKALRFQIGGRAVFAMRVRHPGTAAVPAMAEASLQRSAELAAILEASLGRAFAAGRPVASRGAA